MLWMAWWLFLVIFRLSRPLGEIFGSRGDFKGQIRREKVFILAHFSHIFSEYFLNCFLRVFLEGFQVKF